MAPITGHREPKRPGLLAILAAATVCLGAQPCAVAAVSDADTGCPHGSGDPTTHSAHGHHHDGHEAHKSSPDCDSMQDSCCEAPDLAASDGRLPDKKSKSGGETAVLPLTVAAATDPARAPPEITRVPLTRSPGSARPIHLLNCVFLD